MFGKGLSLNQAPPLKAAMRFFITAPVFLVLAALIYLLNDINTFERWQSSTIGIIHFFNLGFLVMVMMGALTQMLPVLAGVTIPKVLWVSRIVHFLLCIGAILFPLGMIFMKPFLIQIGAISAWISIFIFYSIAFFALQKGIPSFTLTSFKLSSLSALMTLILAGRLAWGWAGFGDLPIYRPEFVELHIAWAFFGMVFILIMGVSYKVVPMFFVTGDHPRWLTHYGSKIIFSLLTVWTIVGIWLPSLIPFIKFGIGMVMFAFAIETIRRLRNRKRPLTDTSIIYWYLAMGLFLLGAILYSESQFITDSELVSLYATISFGLATLSLITGMLYKIIPFLVWLHLTSKGITSVPTTRELLPDRLARKQFYLHCCMTVSLLLQIKYLFSFFLVLSIGTMFFIILKVLRQYRALDNT